LLVCGIYLRHDINRETLMPMLNKAVTAFLTGAALAATPALAQTAGTATAQTGTPTPAPIPVQPTPAPSGTVAQMLAQSTDHTTLQKLITAAGQGAALSGPGPVTIFAPDDAAFGRLAPGTVNELLDPAHQWSAQQIVKYHIVQGSYTAQDLLKQLKTTPTITLNTLDGQPLTITAAGPSAIQLTDAMGGKAFVSKLSDKASNGVIEYINAVLSPKMVAKPAAAPGAAPAPTGTTPPVGTTATPPAGGTTDLGSGNGG
jgi:uncharacterized surface protein with fasciclin (FAS1) repeats